MIEKDGKKIYPCTILEITISKRILPSHPAIGNSYPKEKRARIQADVDKTDKMAWFLKIPLKSFKYNAILWFILLNEAKRLDILKDGGSHEG